MRKILIFIIICGFAVAAFFYWPKIQTLLIKPSKFAQIIKNNQTIQNISQQVFTGGALRSQQNNPDAFLTKTGTINFTNQARKENGNLAPLKENLLLDKSAQNKLADMFKQQYFEHESPQGKGPSDLAENVGYQYVIIGENLALGNFKDDAALVDAWMNSPGHRANILNTKYQEIGVAVGKGIFEGKQVWLAVQEFGRPLSACPQVDSVLKSQIESLKSDVEQVSAQLTTLKGQIDALPEPKTKPEAEFYNQKVAEYNDLVKIYNNKVDQLKLSTEQYNAEVNAFNSCAS